MDESENARLAITGFGADRRALRYFEDTTKVGNSNKRCTGSIAED
jgi:hypothetical protein